MAVFLDELESVAVVPAGHHVGDGLVGNEFEREECGDGECPEYFHECSG